jgi:acyl carrier protein
MEDLRQRLATCFTTVFPKLSAIDAPTATVDTVPAWDSTHHFMLMLVVQEEFGIPIPEETVGEIDSFAALENHLSSNGRGH